jgi:hypothetical protein
MDGWVGLGWVALGWIGLDWVGLDWVWLGWIGLDWVEPRMQGHKTGWTEERVSGQLAREARGTIGPNISAPGPKAPKACCVLGKAVFCFV